MICPIMSFRGNQGYKKCAEKECALYADKINLCAFSAIASSSATLTDLFDESTTVLYTGRALKTIERSI